MFVFPICFVDISKVKGFKDCKDFQLCLEVQRRFLIEIVSCTDSHVHGNCILWYFFHTSSILCSMLAPKFPLSLTILIVLNASLLKRC